MQANVTEIFSRNTERLQSHLLVTVPSIRAPAGRDYTIQMEAPTRADGWIKPLRPLPSFASRKSERH